MQPYVEVLQDAVLLAQRLDVEQSGVVDGFKRFFERHEVVCQPEKVPNLEIAFGACICSRPPKVAAKGKAPNQRAIRVERYTRRFGRAEASERKRKRVV